MNKQLELFIHQLEFDTICKGELHYNRRVSELFEDCPCYVPGFPCDEDSEIWLTVTVTKTCSIRCFLFAVVADDFARTEFSMVNATPGAIEDWILSIDFDAALNEAEDLEDVRAAEEAVKREGTVPWEQVKAELAL